MTRTPGAMKRMGEERLKQVAGQQLIKTVADPEDFVGLVLFRTGADAHFVTGQTMFADGGHAFVCVCV